MLCTPAVNVGILDGITRRIILGLAEELKIETNEGRFRREDVYGAQEVFISNTSMEVMPVASVDNKRISKTSGRITGILRRAYKKIISEYIRGAVN